MKIVTAVRQIHQLLTRCSAHLPALTRVHLLLLDSCHTMYASIVARCTSTHVIRTVFSISCRYVSTRSWSVTRYHVDLHRSLRLLERQALPIVYRPSDVLVRVHAASVNPLDLAMSRGYGQVLLGMLNMTTNVGIDRMTYDRMPLTLGRDFVGEVVATGQAVTDFKQGEKVWGTVMPFADAGSHADYLVTPDCTIWHAPRNLLPVEAASLPYVGLTAWSSLTTFGQVAPDCASSLKCLVLGAGGGVGCIATQLLKSWNAHVTVTCSKRSAVWLQELVSVDCFIEYHELADFLRGYPGQFDLILDASPPEAASANLQLISAWKRNSRMVSQLTTYLTLTSPLLRNFDQHGILSGSLATLAEAATDTLTGLREGLSIRWAYYMPNQAALQLITKLVEEGVIKPITGHIIPFERVIEAYEAVDQQLKMHNGKVVLQMIHSDQPTCKHSSSSVIHS